MYPEEMKSLVCDILFSFFLEYIDEIEQSRFLMKQKQDENKKDLVVEAAGCLWSSEHIRKDKIEAIWSLNKDLLAGLFVYLDTLDSYFDPRMNSSLEFFRKIFIYNKTLLTEIGNKTTKPYFPFSNMKNYKKKIILLR